MRNTGYDPAFDLPNTDEEWEAVYRFQRNAMRPLISGLLDPAWDEVPMEDRRFERYMTVNGPQIRRIR